jgi:hypothetical protein
MGPSPRHFRAVGGGRVEHRRAFVLALCSSLRSRDSGRPVFHSVPGNGADRQSVRADHADLVRDDCASGRLGNCGIPRCCSRSTQYMEFSYLHSGGVTGFLVLGGVFLCVTGAEALYADMGHFGARPIRLAWSAMVFPSLVLNYAGQAALVLEGAPTSDNIFYRLCPSALLIRSLCSRPSPRSSPASRSLPARFR